jgi:hypothetical protein
MVPAGTIALQQKNPEGGLSGLVGRPVEEDGLPARGSDSPVRGGDTVVYTAGMAKTGGRSFPARLGKPLARKQVIPARKKANCHRPATIIATLPTEACGGICRPVARRKPTGRQETTGGVNDGK